MNILLQQVHIFDSVSTAPDPDPVNTEKKFFGLVLGMTNIRIQTLKISNLEKHVIGFNNPIPWKFVTVATLVFDNVSEYVIGFVTTSFNFNLETSLSLKLLCSDITSLTCLDNLRLTFSSVRWVPLSLTLDDLPQLKDFHSNFFFQMAKSNTCIDTLVLSNVGSGHLDLEENRMQSLFFFIGSTELNRLILPMSILKIIWCDTEYSIFYNMKAASVYIENIDDPEIDGSLGLYTHERLYNPNTIK
ncbi:hypothetical protein NEDG_01563 [Nematocida displodere]|uniref:Uncharacterized protein n=1 Tax=Nematocida displodere TaxID=1805483 RepID=A0A177EE83_9MICR|nr:hypothetical protein NEDG_01563 [Nematocida displodere]